MPHRLPRPLPAALAALVLAVLAASCGGGGGETAPSPQADAFARGPYLTRIGETSARLRWIAPSGSAVALTARADDGQTVTADRGTFRDLRPDTRYAWTGSIDGRAEASGAFTTAPRDLSRGVDLIVFADYGAPDDESRAVARLAGEQRARLMITAGDNMYIATLPQLFDSNLFGPFRQALSGAPDYGTVGDHDIPFPAGQAALARALEWPNRGERYDLRYGPVQVVALGLRADAADVAFARRALARPGPLAR
ncbi:MAG TPA: fibronectin type III domain-containing protein, partial [Miltoncostaea sp.]|nr:fibronectin type III domain-containing protein [Miltoncostaea sp.]